ncbi:MAG: hypothetical protein RL095_517 [Verrucomicrobiota bacterium]|jgi:membrane-associated PAP2 superfamily phosphatase
MKRDLKLPLAALASSVLGFAMLLALLRFTRLDVDIVVEMHDYFGDPGPWLHGLSEFGKYFPPVLLLLSLPWCLWRQRRPHPPGWRPWFFCLLVYLSLAALINLGLKPGFGRPRPIDCHEVRAEAASSFVPLLGLPEGPPQRLAMPARSFPSAHAFSAFSLFALFFVLRRRSPRPAILIFIFASCLGLATGIISILELRHFPSDVVASCALVWWLCIVLDLLLLRPAPPPGDEPIPDPPGS